MTLEAALSILISNSSMAVWTARGSAVEPTYSSETPIAASIAKVQLKAIKPGGTLEIYHPDDGVSYAVHPDQTFETQREALEYASKRFEHFAAVAG